ncbi:hypothetical protein GGD55_004719 [Rhizobium giardinii]|uniref:Uncharacterized protein n=1 Tax=Rhizobium giardinii TaxID=56731 RepID=A0A7W8UEZ2_9HYPH|nr:hypothetical protein [Rhizobium giardinii]
MIVADSMPHPGPSQTLVCLILVVALFDLTGQPLESHVRLSQLIEEQTYGYSRHLWQLIQLSLQSVSVLCVFLSDVPNTVVWARSALREPEIRVRWRTRTGEASLLMTKLMDGRVTASQIAATSAASVFPRFT